MVNTFREHEQLAESSLSRVYSHTQKRNIGIISAFRGDNTPAENKKATNALKADIRKSFGYITVKGNYVENKGEKDERVVTEISFLVIGSKDDDKGKLKGYLLKAGAKFKQDSILYKEFNSDNAMLIGTRNGDWLKKGQIESVGKFHPNKVSDYMTTMKHPGKSFTFSENYDIGFYRGGDSFFSRGESRF